MLAAPPALVPQSQRNTAFFLFSRQALTILLLHLLSSPLPSPRPSSFFILCIYLPLPRSRPIFLRRDRSLLLACIVFIFWAGAFVIFFHFYLKFPWHPSHRDMAAIPSPIPKLDRYIVIHVATTCDEHGVYVTKDSAEVIELGWILLDTKNCDEVRPSIGSF